MTETCRLCMSLKLVNNSIFDDDNKIYLKIVSCLPVKVTKDDSLPKKICDMCSCKVNDFYEFCNKAIESENRLLSQTNSSCNFNHNVNSDSPVLSSGERLKFSSNFLQHSHKNGLSIKLVKSQESKDFVTSCTQTDCSNEQLLNLEEIKEEPTISINDFFNDNDDSYSVTNDELKVEFSDKGRDPSEKGKLKLSKKSKKQKNLKMKIKKSKTKYSISNYQSDSDDEISLKNIKMREKKKDNSCDLKESVQIGKVILSMDEIKNELNDEAVEVEFPNKNQEWNCCVCFHRCYDKEEMLLHYRTHCTNPDRLAEIDKTLKDSCDGTGKKKKQAYECMHCRKICESKSVFLRHIKSHGHDKPYKCSLCEKTFRSTLEILKHGKNAHTYDAVGQVVGTDKEKGPRRSTKRFMCDLCDETFVYMRYVQIHRDVHHPESRNCHFVNRCLHCRREFAHLNSLRRHLRSHSGEKNFLCYICGKSLTSREHLKFHIRIHTGFKPNVCKTCGKGFVKKCNLTLHERVHSGEKPHVCSHCGKAFSQRSTLVIHERYHSGARPYVCNLCSKGFVAKGLLSMHMKTSCI